MPDAQRWLDLVRAEAAAVLGCSVEAVPAGQAFADLGFDSLTALELADRLSASSGLTLSGTLAFDHPTPAALADYIAAALGVPEVVPRRVGRAPGADDPIAIVGMACRLPGGVTTPDEFWAMLAQGGDGTGPFPTDRGWDTAIYHPDPDNPGTSYVRHGGFLHNAGDFDPTFFGLSPREALATDPQQRLMLEISWEALERAALAPHTLRGSRTGVFTGVIASDYAPRLGDISPEVAGFLLAGNAPSIVSGRVSYTLGLEGPAVSVDTACSSSLVALHLATRSLRSGECDLALAGGVSVIGTPLVFTEFSRQRGLAPDGRCKSFAGAADGTGWAEGAGVLVLQRLSDARRDGRRVLAVIRGSAVNQDGASNGLTAPNGPSQQRLIAEALADAHLRPADIDVVEGHGTGTRLGDPIEAQALLAAYGQDRQRPLWLGSVKSNLGHTQAAAGVAGVIKMVLALDHQQLPKTLHVDEPTSFVDWSSGRLRLLTEAREWVAGEQPRRAGVSAFGISGTNAHVILEQAPPAEAPLSASHPMAPVPISARTEDALRQQARRWHDFLAAHPQLDAPRVAAAAATRTPFEHRAVLLDHTQLGALAQGSRAPGVITGVAAEGRLALVFPGQGSQRSGMAHALAKASPVFATALDEVCAELDRHLDRPIRGIIDGADGPLDQTGYTQPALFAVEVALFRLISAWGVRPDYVLGHSIGELAAAHVAGALSLPDAGRLVTARGRLMQALPPGGVMVAIQATPDEVLPLLAGSEAELSLAAVNGPRAVVIAGAEGAALRLAGTFAEQGRKTTRLRVSHAFHSPLMEPMLAEFAAAEQRITCQPLTIPLVSNLTGLPIETIEPGYWTRQVRQPVAFAQSVRWLREQGVSRFLEVGPGGALSAMILDCMADPSDEPAVETETGRAAAEIDVVAVPLLRDGRPEPASVLEALARLHVRGVDVDWAAVTGRSSGQLELPTYPFQRKRFWLSSAAKPLLESSVELPGESGTEGLVLTGRLSLAAQPWLADHVVAGTVLVPGALLAELALRAGAETGCPEVSELLLEAPLVLPDQHVVQLRVVVAQPLDGQRALAIWARVEGEPWTCHATGTLAAASGAQASRLKLWPPPGALPLDVAGFYAELAARGYGYGPHFQGLRRAWQRGDEIFAEVALPAELAEQAGQFGLHPALLDAALHVISLNAESSAGVSLPFSWSGLSLYATGAAAVRVRVTRRGEEISLSLADSSGAPVASVRRIALRPITADQVAARTGGDYEVRWVPAVDTAEPWAGSWGRLPGFELTSDPAVPDVVFAQLPTDSDELHQLAGKTLSLVRQWLADPRYAAAKLVLLTRFAAGPAGNVGRITGVAPQPSRAARSDQGDAPAMTPARAAIWGLLRSAQSEHPGRFVLLDVDDPDPATQLLLQAVGSGEPQIAIRAGELFVPRLARAPHPPTRTARQWDPNGTVLITGGCGALGRMIAKHLTTHWGVRHLLLIGRRGPATPGAAESAAELRALGATSVRIAACDVADPAALTALLASVPAAHPLTAVLHLAGVLDDGVIESQTPQRLSAVLRPKADAAWHLHELTKEHDLAAFVLFSSAAGLFGSPGQGGYAAANAYLDALAQQRRAQGLPGQALAWGLWEQVGGMADQVSPAGIRRMRGIGLAPLTEQRGLGLLDAALRADSALLVLAEIDTALLSAHDQHDVPVVLRGLVRTPARRAVTASAPVGPNLAQTLPGLEPAEQERLLRDLVLREAASVLGHASATELDASRSLPELGFDSLTAVELRNRLATATGLRLPATLVLDHPGVTALTGYLLAELVPQQASTALGVLENLTRLEAGIANLSMDAVARKRLTDSLSRILARVDSGPDKIDATQDDFFDLIDG